MLVVFCVAVFPWLGTFCRVIAFLVAVETSEMTQVLVSYTGNVGGIDTGGWGGVFLGSL